MALQSEWKLRRVVIAEFGGLVSLLANVALGSPLLMVWMSPQWVRGSLGGAITAQSFAVIRFQSLCSVVLTGLLVVFIVAFVPQSRVAKGMFSISLLVAIFNCIFWMCYFRVA